MYNVISKIKSGIKSSLIIIIFIYPNILWGKFFIHLNECQSLGAFLQHQDARDNVKSPYKKEINSFIIISGIVQNGLDGSPLSNVKVSFKEGEASTLTDNYGFFKLNILSSLYTNQNSDFSPIELHINKEGYHTSKYPIVDRLENLIIGLLPIPEKNWRLNDSALHLASTDFLNIKVNWERIIDGVRLFHEKRLIDLKPIRERYWNRDLSSQEAYSSSIEPNREKLRNILGAIDKRESVSIQKDKITETPHYSISEIKWSVLKEVIPGPALQDWPPLDVPRKIFGEGLILEPKEKSKGFVIAIPDADQNPESIVGLNQEVASHSQFARRLVENGYSVVVPVIIDRSNRWSRGTNRSSRSWIYAQTHELGRTVAGYEIQKMEALVDWFELQKEDDQQIGIVGYGEGGLLAFYTAALDRRIDATLVSGYFAPREEIWKEPIYRNVWGLLKEFGDAEVASLIAPRSLVIEYSSVPAYEAGNTDGKRIEPPGSLWTHPFFSIESEFQRIESLTGKMGKRVLLKSDTPGQNSFCTQNAIDTLLRFMGNRNPVILSNKLPKDQRVNFNAQERMERMVQQMVGHTQLLLRNSEYVRQNFVKDREDKDPESLRRFYKQEMVGWIHDDFLPIYPRTKLVENKADYLCYEVVLDVLPEIEMWGGLLIPKNLKPLEKRPTVVLQHGRGGNPYTALDENNTYFGVGRRLAEMGFVVFTPFGNWTGETRFRWIDRIAKPSKSTLWSTVGRQHQQLLRWFQTLPFIDTDNIAIYGKSIGGQAASLIASMIPEYALSINCAFFNEGARKKSSIYFPTGFVFHVDSEMPMWNRGHTLEDAEMTNKLIFPRPFMVEHGRKDGIAPPGWVEYEYNKIQKFYNEQGKKDHTDIDLHDGGHIINGIKSIPFLRKHLNLLE